MGRGGRRGSGWDAAAGVIAGGALVAASFGLHALATGLPAASAVASYGLPGLSPQWPVFGGNPWMDRFAPLPALTPTAAARLQAAFTIPLLRQGQSQEGFPVVVDGRMYVSTDGGGVVAADATTGAVLWKRPAAGSGPNRGVAVAGGRVFVLDRDNRLVALDAGTGRQIFSAPVGVDAAAGYFEATAPVVADGLVVVGISGGDLGARGFVEGLSATDGHQVWRFYTVPAPGQGWVPATGNHGGGAVWTPVAIDPATATVYASVGNPSPDFYGANRPGPNPYTDGVVALDLHTGALRWYGSEVNFDLWDYDAASPPLLFALPDGRTGVGEAGKGGYWFEWDAATGAQLVPPLPFVKEDHTPPSASGTLEWPGTWGGANYGPSAYDPTSGLAFISGIEQPQIITAGPGAHDEGAADFGTGMADVPGQTGTGSITAVDVATGLVRWRFALPHPALGGVTVTAGGLVLFGTVDGRVYGLDAATGRQAWSASVGADVGTAPVVYQADGQIYVALATGGGGMGGAARRDGVTVWRLGP